ncbi:MAG: aromatic amino acid aminotransferase [Betaproteobacteria bacterium RIFCSPHIGHO2_12_FULL_69_13]|nr:MAG: aromatic amino acid aminotransferase [Betaproteobacteria bacterium RIFCSPHIGHO2_12_FULL_69_13]OGA65631.1 MAG: aromatic amino acid aminotransferase [Betaproteobacteria bacterium RIFCSPLOWO2_12_FULL_68_20]
MNAPHIPSPLAAVPMAPGDPILGVTETFNADPNPRKVNLGVGIYYGEDGKVPLLECVRRAERARVDAAPSRAYLPIDGLPAYDQAVRTLLLGESGAVRERRVVTVQTLGGTGGLKLGADFLRRIVPGAEAWISDPSWENHRAIFEGAGFAVREYPYYDPKTRGVRFDAMLDSLKALPAGTVVVLHACCHNPTGVDLSHEQWQQVLGTVQARGLIPFVDLAYQGFGDGLEADAYAARLFAGAMTPVFLSSSFSKSFSLYGERVGAFSLVAGSADEAARALSQVKRLVRANYSNPPTHGGQIVAAVLTTPELRRQWEEELGQMRERIKAMRRALVDGIRARAPGADFDFVLRQRGLFCYSGLDREQVRRLHEEYSIYAVETGRICVAALNSRNVGYAAEAIAAVIR